MKVIQSTWLVPKGFAAITIGCLVFVRPENIKDVGLIEHEQVHCEQFKQDWLMPIKYLLSKRKRLEYEVEAYKVSIACGWSVDAAVKALMTYNTGYKEDVIRFKLGVA